MLVNGKVHLLLAPSKLPVMKGKNGSSPATCSRHRRGAKSVGITHITRERRQIDVRSQRFPTGSTC